MYILEVIGIPCHQHHSVSVMGTHSSILIERYRAYAISIYLHEKENKKSKENGK